MVCQGCSGYIYSYTNTKKIEKNKEQLSKKKTKKRSTILFVGLRLTSRHVNIITD